ncbi:glycosyltransferase [Niallia oryzisoli]|uniref:glycosyltransferase n=1 Tax=Niallia oryzisoli TaxID=1737571 RepID=UPI003736374F
MKLTIVVVFYQQRIEQAKTFVSLTNALVPRDQDDIEIILYDNSKNKQDFNAAGYPGLGITYTHDPRNLGIAAAYNYAWKKAQVNGSEWLLLFDHDTQVTKEYIEKMIKDHAVDEQVAAVVPKINSNNTMISPVFSHSLRPLTLERPAIGLQTEPVMAINSGTLVRVSFINELGGFNEAFALDYLDHWLFYEIYAKGKKVFLVDVTLEHELSVMDYSTVSLNRYKSILDAEMKFYSAYKKDLLGAYRKQLFKRFVKQVLVVKNKKIALETIKQLF